MPGIGKIILGTGIGAGVIGLIAYVSKLKAVGDKLDTVTSASIHSLKLNGLTIRVDVTLKNPTEGTLKIKQPYVKIMFGEKVIGTSQILNKTIQVTKYGVKQLEPIFITIPATGLLTLGDGIVKVLIKKQTAKITTVTMTTIDLGWKKVPYMKKDESILKPNGTQKTNGSRNTSKTKKP